MLNAQPAPEEYRGKCPCCSAQLELEAAGDTLKCPVDHYVISRYVFEAAWDEYETSGGTPFDAEALLDILLEGNTSPNKPAIQAVATVKK